MAYVIKRYSNRKLYDTQESRYVTLEEIEEMIRAGREISVVDAGSGEDHQPGDGREGQRRGMVSMAGALHGVSPC